LVLKTGLVLFALNCSKIGQTNYLIALISDSRPQSILALNLLGLKPEHCRVLSLYIGVTVVVEPKETGVSCIRFCLGLQVTASASPDFVQ
jgi:hypothetical protein